jgi:hypothetical protein
VAGSGAVGNNAGGTYPEPGGLTSSTLFNSLPSGLTLYGNIAGTLDAYLSALEATNRFKIISTPGVYTSNNKLAIIADGEQVPVPSNITSGVESGNSNLTTTASVTYENVLLQLDIIPLINASHEVTLQIRQTNDSLGNSVTISGNSVPSILTQEINTEITVPNQSTVVIGGLIRDTTERDAGGLPWLSDIPVLGYLFGAVDKAKKREELIIMIQPSVVANDADQTAVDEEEKRRTILGHEAVDAANGTAVDQGNTLPWAPNYPEPKYPSNYAPYNSKGTTVVVPVPRVNSPQLEPIPNTDAHARRAERRDAQDQPAAHAVGTARRLLVRDVRPVPCPAQKIFIELKACVRDGRRFFRHPATRAAHGRNASMFALSILVHLE